MHACNEQNINSVGLESTRHTKARKAPTLLHPPGIQFKTTKDGTSRKALPLPYLPSSHKTHTALIEQVPLSGLSVPSSVK